MKNRIVCTCSALVVAGLFTATSALADESVPYDEEYAPSNLPESVKLEEMMMKAELAGTPGAAHAVLEPLIGEWTAEVKWWLAPDAPPTVSNGTATVTWAMNGRFVREDFEGDMMGKPFHGMGLTGFDSQKQKYNSVWVDNMSTAIFTSQGAAEQDGKMITFDGKMDCPMTGEKDMTVRHVLRIDSRDRHVFEMHNPSKGDNSKAMEITYTRKLDPTRSNGIDDSLDGND